MLTLNSLKKIYIFIYYFEKNIMLLYHLENSYISNSALYLNNFHKNNNELQYL